MKSISQHWGKPRSGASGLKGEHREEPVYNRGTAGQLARGCPHSGVDNAVVHGRTRNFRKRPIAMLLAFALPVYVSVVIPAQAQVAEPVAAGTSLQADATYHFNWRMIGAASVLPYQVFDDGQRTYIQFASDVRVPAIFTEGPAGMRAVSWRLASPYLIVDETPSVLVFRLGNTIGKAIRSGVSAGPQGIATGAALPVRVTHSAPAPVSRTSLNAAAPAFGTGPASLPPVLIADSSVAPTTTSNPLAAAPDSWTLQLADRDVATALKRWVRTTGWTLQWDSTIVAPITGDSTVSGPLDHALATVVRALRDAGYPLSLASADPVKQVWRIYQDTAAAPLAKVTP